MQAVVALSKLQDADAAEDSSSDEDEDDDEEEGGRVKIVDILIDVLLHDPAA